jgi:S-adenosyl methyltransferase
MSRPEFSVQQTDSAPAHAAGVCGYWLGGSDHGPADRAAAAEVARCYPGVVDSVRAVRDFGRRVAWYGGNGRLVRQFLDIGAGFPGADSTHEIVRLASRGCRVVYADIDPVVAERCGDRVRAGTRGAGEYICADVRDPAELLARAGAVLDFAEPAVVLLLGVLAYVPDDGDPAGIVAGLAAALAPGSLIAVAHLTADFSPGAVDAGVGAWNALMPAAPVYPRGEAAVTAMLGGLRLQLPGVVRAGLWRPPFRSPGPGLADVYAGVASLPRPGDSG